MQFGKTLIFAVIFLALGAYVYFVEVPKARKEGQKERVVTFDKERVRELALTYADRSIRLKKGDGGRWRITAPLETDADEATVENLIDAIADAEVEKVLEEVPDDLAPYGLDEPHATLQVEVADGPKVPTILVGKTTPVGFKTYVQRGEEKKVFLTPSSFYYGTDKQVKDLRRKEIMDFRDEDVTAIEIAGEGTRVVVARDGSDWRIEEPAVHKVDATEMGSFLSSLHGLRALDFIDGPEEDAQDYGFTSPALRVKLSLGEKADGQTLLVGGEAEDADGEKRLYAKRQDVDTVYVVGQWALKDLRKGPGDLRDKTVLTFDDNDARRIVVRQKGGEEFTLVRGEGQRGWTLAQAEAGEVDTAAAQRFVEDLEELRGYEIAADDPPDLAAYALDSPQLSVTVYGDDAKELGSVVAGGKGEGEDRRFYAMRGGGGGGTRTVLTLRDWIFDRINKKRADFLAPPPAEAKAEEAGEQPAK